MIAAVIPTRYRPPQLGPLLEVLAHDRVSVHIMDSDLFDHRIYAMWNTGATLGRLEGASEIAFLNDDAELLPGTLPLMAEALLSDPTVGIVYPDVNAVWTLPAAIDLQPTEGTWGAGGMTGFCFMARADLPATFDEGFAWWYGDDAYEADVRALGLKVARVAGLPVRHTPNGSASRDWDRLGPLVAQDRERWEGRVRA